MFGENVKLKMWVSINIIYKYLKYFKLYFRLTKSFWSWEATCRP